MSNTIVDQNAARVHGGGVYSMTNLDVNDSTVTNNKAAQDGGGIYMIDAPLAVAASTLGYNVAHNNGGGIYVSRSADATYPQTLTVNDSSVVNNLTQVDGGGIYIEDGVDTTFEAAKVNRNRAITGSGGGVLIVDETTASDDLTPFTINNSQFTLNQAAEGDGGAIYARGNIQMALAHTSVTHNTGKFASGISHVASIGANYGELTITHSTIDYNKRSNDAAASAGGIQLMSISNTFVRHNEGTGIGIGGVANVVLSNNVVTHNSNESNAANGGGIDLKGIGNATIDSMYIAENSTLGDGGGISINALSSTLRNSTIYKNSAVTGGGVSTTVGFFEISAVAIDNNTASATGGGIAISGQTNGNLSQASVTNNSAENGAGIHVSANDVSFATPPNIDNIQISQILIGYNTASGSGGGVYISDADEVDVTIDRSAVYRNAAVTGGGLYHKGDLLALSNSSISENRATNLGSAIYGNSPFTTFYTTIADNVDSAAIHKVASADTFELRLSIIHNPTVDNCAGDSSSINIFRILDSDGTCSAIRTALTGVDPMIAPLTDNGNNQMSHALLAGSPALSAGTNCPQFDQHGLERPTDNCDLGAYQTRLVPTAVTLSTAAAHSPTANNSVAIMLFALTVLSGCALARRKTQHNA